MMRRAQRYRAPMKVLLARPLGLRSRLDILRAARQLGDTAGWWRVVLFGRTGPIPKTPLRFEWHQVDVALVPGMLPAFINAKVSELRSTGWTVRHWLVDGSPSTFCIRARRRRCLDCDIEPELREKLRRCPCSTCRGLGYVR